MWIVRLALRNPYTIAVACGVLLLMSALAAMRMAVDIFPLIDIPVVAVVWTYPGMLPKDMEARVVLLSRARPVVDGQRHLAHRVAVGGGRRPGQGLLPAGHGHRDGDRADRGVLADVDQGDAAGHHAAVRHPGERVERAGGAAHDVVADDARAGDLRLRAELHSAPPLHHSGPVDAAAVRRQDPRDHDRRRPAVAEQQGTRGAGRPRRAAAVEHHSSRRLGAHRHARVRRGDELQSVDGRGLRATFRSRS